ncbi:MAG: hypothetical protein WBF03_22520 [Xanthobacteraceae bacterium]
MRVGLALVPGFSKAGDTDSLTLLARRLVKKCVFLNQTLIARLTERSERPSGSYERTAFAGIINKIFAFFVQMR